MIVSIEQLANDNAYRTYNESLLYTPSPYRSCYTSGMHKTLNGLSFDAETYYVCGPDVPTAIRYKIWRVCTKHFDQTRFYYLIDIGQDSHGQVVLYPIFVQVYFEGRPLITETHFLLEGICHLLTFWSSRDLKVLTTTHVDMFGALTRIADAVSFREAMYIDYIVAETLPSDIFSRYKQIKDPRAYLLEEIVTSMSNMTCMFYNARHEDMEMYGEERERLRSLFTPPIDILPHDNVDWMLTHMPTISLSLLQNWVTPIGLDAILLECMNMPKVTTLNGPVVELPNNDNIIFADGADFVIESGCMLFQFIKELGSPHKKSMWFPGIEQLSQDELNHAFHLYREHPFTDQFIEHILERWGFVRFECRLNKDDLIYELIDKTGIRKTFVYNLVLHMLTSTQLIALDAGSRIV